MMHIGELAREAGTTTRTVRYYEEMGLVSPIGRSQGGFRCYSEEQLDRLRMILSLKELEFELDHIKSILDKQGNHRTGGHLAAGMLDDLRGRLDDVNTQIAHYGQIRQKLSQAISSLCHCLPCHLRLDERLCTTCEVLRKENGTCVPFFHAQTPVTIEVDGGARLE